MELSFVIKVPNRLNLGKTQEFVLQVLETGCYPVLRLVIWSFARVTSKGGKNKLCNKKQTHEGGTKC